MIGSITESPLEAIADSIGLKEFTPSVNNVAVVSVGVTTNLIFPASQTILALSVLNDLMRSDYVAVPQV